MTISREKISFLYTKLRNFIDSLEKKFLLNTKKQVKVLKENLNKMEIDDNNNVNKDNNDDNNDDNDNEIIDLNAERMKLTYTRNEGKINPNTIEVFSIK